MKTGISVLFALSVTLAARAQKTPDYVINTKGDTIKCFISLPFIGSAEYTLPDGSISPLEDSTYVKEYYSAKANLRKRAVNIPGIKKPVYLEVVEDGKIIIYFQQYIRYNTEYLAWHIFKKADPEFNINNMPLSNNSKISSAKVDILKLVSDNPAAVNMCNDKKKLSYDDVRDIIHFYNTGEVPKVAKKKTDDMY